MENQEKSCCGGQDCSTEKSCCTGMKKHWKRIIVKVIILLIGIAIGCAIGGHAREGRGFEMNGFRGGMLSEGKGMMKGFDREDDKKLSTGDLATLKANQVVIKAQMTKVAALQDDYASMQRFIQRGDITNAASRIDVVIKELSQLKADLPTLSTLNK
ncbi:MAG: hypothetical protein NTX91_01975 [candidate division SR1 bacterium]|nr:hypothetical protein [candidate division SR1 bacterium]